MATDNAVSALGRLMEHHSEALGENALAVADAWVAALPLKVDTMEASAMHELLVRLLEVRVRLVQGPGAWGLKSHDGCSGPEELRCIGRRELEGVGVCSAGHRILGTERACSHISRGCEGRGGAAARGRLGAGPCCARAPRTAAAGQQGRMFHAPPDGCADKYTGSPVLMALACGHSSIQSPRIAALLAV
jgi:hypothetical protein